MNKTRVPALFFLLALTALFIGLFFGLVIGHEYASPGLLKELLPFNRMRELHVASVVSWIVLAATGGVYYYIQEDGWQALHNPRLSKVHFWLFLFTGIAILVSIAVGPMGGREYLTFYPALMIPIIFGWILFAYNYFKTAKTGQKWPVYKWMWATGSIFMIYHLTESNLWVIPYFRERFILDLTVQWKSYGSFVGSWNMLIYGTAIYLMSQIKKDSNIARSKTAFFFYFLGFTNLILGWAHHLYPVPGAPWIRGVGYAISMTEWLVLAQMIYAWAKAVKEDEKRTHAFSYKMLIVTDFWIIGNVFIALLISIPAINQFTHGTHITVAHSMGTTIGINSSILIASIYYAIGRWTTIDWGKYNTILMFGKGLFHLALLGFLSCLLISGYHRGQWMMSGSTIPFSDHFDSLALVYDLFYVAGSLLVVAIVMLVWPAYRMLWKFVRNSEA
ncbi:MAG: nitric oxide reductase subunit B [Bacteroidia bacterium]|jgi:nitric oxide reductase subunit B